jgi:hypothetical protein
MGLEAGSAWRTYHPNLPGLPSMLRDVRSGTTVCFGSGLERRYLQPRLGDCACECLGMPSPDSSSSDVGIDTVARFAMGGVWARLSLSFNFRDMDDSSCEVRSPSSYERSPLALDDARFPCKAELAIACVLLCVIS